MHMRTHPHTHARTLVWHLNLEEYVPTWSLCLSLLPSVYIHVTIETSSICLSSNRLGRQELSPRQPRCKKQMSEIEHANLWPFGLQPTLYPTTHQNIAVLWTQAAVGGKGERFSIDPPLPPQLWWPSYCVPHVHMRRPGGFWTGGEVQTYWTTFTSRSNIQAPLELTSVSC